MALENLLLPGETVKYRSPGKVRIGSRKYELITTEKRLILYRRVGTVFKREEFKADSIPEIQAISYREDGNLLKRGTVKMKVQGGGYLAYSGPVATIRTVYNEFQQYTVHAKD